MHFALSHKRIRDSKATANNADFASANIILEEEATQLANLAENTQADRHIIVTPMATNTHLVAELATANATLRVAVTDIAALRV